MPEFVEFRSKHGGLTPRQFEIVTLLANGFTSQQIAERLFISKRTVVFHLEMIYQTLSTRNAPHTVVTLMRAGLSIPVIENSREENCYLSEPA